MANAVASVFDKTICGIPAMFVVVILPIACIIVTACEAREAKRRKRRAERKRWRQLQLGNSLSTVRKLIGEPDRVQADSDRGLITWHYPRGGSIEFDGDVLVRWVEPS